MKMQAVWFSPDNDSIGAVAAASVHLQAQKANVAANCSSCTSRQLVRSCLLSPCPVGMAL